MKYYVAQIEIYYIISNYYVQGVRAAYLEKSAVLKWSESMFICSRGILEQSHIHISFGNNVHVTSGVTSINHDITSLMFQYG